MEKSSIRNITGGGITLPSPYSGTLPPGKGVIVEGDPDEVTTNLGGADSINGILQVSAAGATEPLDVHSSSNNTKAIKFVAPAANAVAVHAVVAADGANVFPGPFTDPAIPRVVQCDFSVTYDGGDVTVGGTNQFDEPITDVIVAVANTIVQGVKVFKTVTSASKTAVGTGGQTVDLETGIALGIQERVKNAAGILTADGVAEAVTIDPVENKFVPATTPDGSVDFDLLCNV
jgi:hypothetical protein